MPTIRPEITFHVAAQIRKEASSEQLSGFTHPNEMSPTIASDALHPGAIGLLLEPSDKPSTGATSLGVMVTPITGVWTAGNRCLSSGPMDLLKRVPTLAPQTAPRLVCRTTPVARADARPIRAASTQISDARSEAPSGRSHTQRPQRGPVWCRGP